MKREPADGGLSSVGAGGSSSGGCDLKQEVGIEEGGVKLESGGGGATPAVAEAVARLEVTLEREATSYP